MDKVKELIDTDSRLTCKDIALDLDKSVGSVHTNLTCTR